MVIGAKGDLGGGWAYDVFGQYGDTVYQEEYLNDVSIMRFQNALDINPDGNCAVADSAARIRTVCRGTSSSRTA